MIQLRDLRVVKNKAEICHVAELDVAKGERLGVLGSNGSGKSTLLRVIAGMETDFFGHRQIGVEHKKCIYVRQSPYLFRGTVLSNVAYGLAARGAPRQERNRQACVWMKRLGIAHLANSRPEHLSGGERRRTALARALAIDPDLLLLDEPFAEMDNEGMQAVLDVFRDLPHTTIVIAAPNDIPSGCINREIWL